MPKVIAPEALIKSSGLVLFLGAGASADFDIPVTSALKEEFLEKYPSRKKFFSALGSVLESFRSPNDIEQILALCKSLADPLEAIRLGGPYAVFLRSRTRSMSFAHDLRARRLARRIESFLVERCRLP